MNFIQNPKLHNPTLIVTLWDETHQLKLQIRKYSRIACIVQDSESYELVAIYSLSFPKCRTDAVLTFIYQVTHSRNRTIVLTLHSYIIISKISCMEMAMGIR